MLRTITISVFFVVSWCQVAAQIDIRERLYIHASRQTLIAGQTLHYSAYNLSEETGQLSSLSKLAYVQLVGKDGAILQQKIALTEGRGAGTIFISSLMPSGHYYLVANTRWMKNFDSRVKIPITLINPFEAYVPPVKLTEGWEISYAPSGGSLIAGIENSLVIKVCDEFGIKVPFEGKLVDQSNEVVTSFVTDQPGYATISFTPTDGDEYRVILEDGEQNFHFSKLPGVSNRPHTIQLKEGNASIRLVSQTIESNATLEVSTLQNTIERIPFENELQRSFQKSTLSHGLMLFSLKDANGNTLVSKSHYLDKHQVIHSAKETVVSKNTQITERFMVPAGSYSVAVRKKYGALSEASTHAVSSALDFHTTVGMFDERPVGISLDQLAFKLSVGDSVEFLPESMNELLSGRILNGEGIPMAHQYLGLSQLDQISQTVISKSNDQGRFLFHFSSSPLERMAIATSLDSDALVFEFEKEFIDFAFEHWPTYALDSIAIQEVVKLSLHNQIENIYLDPVKETTQVGSWFEQFEPFDFAYRLDDYTRFATMPEYFTEYILGARVRGNQIKITSKYYESSFDEKPLLLLDGVPVSATTILDLNPATVDRVGVVANRYYLGALVADGLLCVKTYDNNFGGLAPNDLGQPHMIHGLHIPREYQSLDYSSTDRKHMPDKRTLLFWNPNMANQQDSLNVSFFTSDLVGEFEMIIQGISESGIPVTEIRAFSVE